MTSISMGVRKMLVNLVRYAEKDEDKNVSEGVNFDTAALPLSSKISLVSTVVKLRRED